MKVTYKSKKLEKECSDYSLLVKSYGLQIAKKVIQRLNELESSSDLSVMRGSIRKMRIYNTKKFSYIAHSSTIIIILSYSSFECILFFNDFNSFSLSGSVAKKIKF